MKTQRILLCGVAAFATLIGVGGCTGMSRQDQNTLAGAGIGGIAGAALTNGSVGGTLGGAAAGGIIGRVITPNNESYYNNGHGYGYDENGHLNDGFFNERQYNGRPFYNVDGEHYGNY